MGACGHHARAIDSAHPRRPVEYVHVQVVSTYAYCTCELLRTGRDAPPVSEDGLKVLSAEDGLKVLSADGDSGFVCTR